MNKNILNAIEKKKLSNYFYFKNKNNKFMGSVSISQNGEPIYSMAIGYSDLENSKKANLNTKYRIASITKSFTSVLVLKAIEENMLTLDTKISLFFPKFRNADRICISNLLNHRSGIFNYTDSEDYLLWNTHKKSESEMLFIIEKGEFDFEPGSNAKYSNSNYLLLSYILEKIYNTSFSKLIIEKITKPLGVKNTFLGKKINTIKNESMSYQYKSKWKKEMETDLSITIGSGGLVSNPSDLNLFSYALFNLKLINESSLELMKTIHDGYGFGLVQLKFGEKIGFGHTGRIDGFISVYGYFPNEKIAFALTSNGSNYDYNSIVIYLLKTVFKESLRSSSTATASL